MCNDHGLRGEVEPLIGQIYQEAKIWHLAVVVSNLMGETGPHLRTRPVERTPAVAVTNGAIFDLLFSHLTAG